MHQNSCPAPPRLFTIGHSNHSSETFLDLLRGQHIEVVVDVRSSPYAGYAAHFNRRPLENFLTAAAIEYLFLGDALGGRPEGRQFYDSEGRVLYDCLAGSAAFQQGVSRLLAVIHTRRAALLCGEEDPRECHRRLLVGRVLGQRGIEVLHIRGDGQVQSEQQVVAEEAFQKTKGQMTLFDKEEPQWKSTQSVLPRRPRPNSSGSSAGPESVG